MPFCKSEKYPNTNLDDNEDNDNAYYSSGSPDFGGSYHSEIDAAGQYKYDNNNNYIYPNNIYISFSPLFPTYPLISTTSLFGNINTNNNQGGGLFTNINTNTNNNQGGGLFGNINTNTNNNQGGGGLFGNNKTNNNQGGGLFGNANNNNNNLNSPSSTISIFGNNTMKKFTFGVNSNNNNNTGSFFKLMN